MQRLANPQEDALVRTLGDKFDAALVAAGKSVVRQITIEAINNQGLDPKKLQYVFWVLMEGSLDTWPNLPAIDLKMLNLALTVMSRTGATPNYRSGFRPVEVGEEDVVDKTILALGVWSRQEFVIGLYKTWSALVLDLSKQVPRVTNGVVGMDRARTWLGNSFRDVLSMRLSWFDHGLLMQQVLKLIPTA